VGLQVQDRWVKFFTGANFFRGSNWRSSLGGWGWHSQLSILFYFEKTRPYFFPPGIQASTDRVTDIPKEVSDARRLLLKRQNWVEGDSNLENKRLAMEILPSPFVRTGFYLSTLDSSSPLGCS